MTDLLIIHPGAQHGIYGALGDTLTAIESPTWARMIAGYVADAGFTVSIIDQEALGISAAMVAGYDAESDPRYTLIVVSGHQPSASTQQMTAAGDIARAIKKLSPNRKIVMCGNHPSALPVRTLQEEAIDYVIDGEGPVTIVDLLRNRPVHVIPGLVWRKVGGPCHNEPAPLIEDLRTLHGDVWSILPMFKYRAHNWHAGFDEYARQPYASIYTTLGCPYHCLAGSTLVNTLYGDIPIKELSELYNEVPVYTYDRKTKKAKISTARNIRCYGKDRLVRVHFDDGTHTDCTPDHKFLTFKWGNQNVGEREFIVDARDLEVGVHVRALRFGVLAGYPEVLWARKKRQKIHRMVMEWKIGRELLRSEIVHHIDHDRDNWQPDNLELCASAKEHVSLHPEVAQRMRDHNPTRNGVSLQTRERMSASLKGLKRSPVAIENYRKAALKREENRKGVRWWTRVNGSTYRSIRPESATDRLGRWRFDSHRGGQAVNHRVVSVEPLPGLHDVYCLEVPDTGWFYANNVLVKNCSFCMINVFQHANRYRRFPTDFIVDQIEYLYTEFGIRNLKIADEMFLLNSHHYLPIAEGLIARGLGNVLNVWAYARVDTVDKHHLVTLRSAGFKWLALGIESGSAEVRDGADKRLRTDDIIGTVRLIQNAGIAVIGNFMFGLRDDTVETMQQTLDLAIRCEPEFANFYSVMAYPGSKLYAEAIEKGWTLPNTWRGFSQHNDDCRPLDTAHVDAATVLRFRDEAFRTFYTNSSYLNRIRVQFGTSACDSISDMLRYKLTRKLLGS